jgi:hypothetical protein
MGGDERFLAFRREEKGACWHDMIWLKHLSFPRDEAVRGHWIGHWSMARLLVMGGEIRRDRGGMCVPSNLKDQHAAAQTPCPPTLTDDSSVPR